MNPSFTRKAVCVALASCFSAGSEALPVAPVVANGSLLAASPAVARRIVFETTEFSLIEAPEAVQAFSALVRGLGAGFALDNMLIRGEALKRLEVLLPDYVKIAPGNTADLASSAEARFLVASLVRIANPLDVRVIANNVEELALVDTLERLGVGGYQGYASGAPAPW